MKNTKSLTSNRDFLRLYKKGQSRVLKTCVLYIKKNRYAYNRLGVSASKKLGGAVVRNRARRRLKEAYRNMEQSLKTGYDIVIVARSGALYKKHSFLISEMYSAFKSTGIYVGSDDPGVPHKTNNE